MTVVQNLRQHSEKTGIGAQSQTITWCGGVGGHWIKMARKHNQRLSHGVGCGHFDWPAEDSQIM